MNDSAFLQNAIEQARTSFAKGGFPAGAVLVKEGTIIATGISMGAMLNDPSGHAEMSCIRKACKELEATDLNSCILYASMEPCLMCFSMANWANLPRIVYGCKKEQWMVDIGCYEGNNSVSEINAKNRNVIEMHYMETYCEDVIALIREWEKKTSH